MARVLVTGATGFVGGAVARRLRSRGEDVEGLGRSEKRGAALERDGIRFVQADVRDADAVAGAVRDCARVVHCAAEYHSQGLTPAEFLAVNAGGTAHVLAACARHGVDRLVHVSTVNVYGRLHSTPATEDHPFGDLNPFQRSKVEAERRVWAALEGPLAGRVAVVRPSGIYGPGDPKFVKLYRALQRRRFVWIGPCRSRYHATFVDDAVEGIVRALVVEGAGGRAYNLAGPRIRTVRELVLAAARAVGAPPPRLRVPLWPVRVAAFACEALCRPLHVGPPLHRGRLTFFAVDHAYAIDRARAELGWAPKVDLDEGFARGVAWCRSRGLIGGGSAADGPRGR